MKKRFAALDATVIILSAACIALCVALALVKPTYLVFVVGVLLVVGIVVGLNIRWFRHRLARLLHARYRPCGTGCFPKNLYYGRWGGVIVACDGNLFTVTPIVLGCDAVLAGGFFLS